MPKYSVLTRAGQRQEIEITVDDYKAAADHNISLSQYLERKYGGAGNDAVDTSQASVLEQAMAAAGLFVNADRNLGINPPTMKAVFEGNAEIGVGPITRNDGNSNSSPSGRLLFPEVVLQIMQHELEESNEDFLGGYSRMVAQTHSNAGPKFEQPIINASGPKGDESASQPISQLAGPALMVGITVADTSRRIPTKSIGLEISDEAMRSVTLDLVSLIVGAQSRAERVRMVEQQLHGMIDGDIDFGEAAIGAEHIKAYDSSIASAGQITHKAWVKWLRSGYRKRNIDWCIMDIDTALKVENREGKPTVQSDDPNSPRIDVLMNVNNLMVRPPNVLLVETDVVGADTIVGLDSRYAIRRVINVQAAYQAIEQFVLRRSTAMRFDYGEMAHKLYADAWAKTTLTTG